MTLVPKLTGGLSSFRWNTMCWDIGSQLLNKRGGTWRGDAGLRGGTWLGEGNVLGNVGCHWLSQNWQVITPSRILARPDVQGFNSAVAFWAPVTGDNYHIFVFIIIVFIVFYACISRFWATIKQGLK